jgi:hypothetical protein
MKIVTFHRFLFLILTIVISISVCNGQQGTGISGAAKSTNKGFFGNLFGKNRKSNVRAPKSVGQIEKEQAQKKKKDDLAWAKSVKESQKRTVKIQSPAVQDRMKQNQKEIVSREKAKKNNSSTLAKPAKRKYKR